MTRFTVGRRIRVGDIHYFVGIAGIIPFTVSHISTCATSGEMLGNGGADFPVATRNNGDTAFQSYSANGYAMPVHLTNWSM
jgi:hypothetical protein